MRAGPATAGYLALPAGAGPFPGVVVIHEAYGLNDNIRRIADRFAAAGYAAFAVDLFAGQNRVVCMARFFGGLLFNSTANSGIRDLKQALSELAVHPKVDPARLGAVGFCLGGGFAIAWACTDERLKAIAPFYGTNPRPLDAVRRSCPVVGSYPEKDFSRKSGEKLATALEAYGIVHDVKVYPGAHHSFMNDGKPSYDAEAAGDAWIRILAFFGEHLAGAPGRPG